MPIPVLKVDDTILRQRVAKLIRASQDASEAFEEIAQVLASSVEKNFADEGRFLSAGNVMGGPNKWPQLAPATVAKRAKSGRGAHPILQVHGQLAASITTQAGPKHASIGSHLVYAAIHQFGGQAGRGRKVTIPARPYLVVQDDDISDMLEIIADHLTRAKP